MTRYPIRYPADQAPQAILELVDRLLPELIAGDHPALVALREQFSTARITHVDLTGVGFYVDFAVSGTAPLAEPPSFAGGDAEIALEGAVHGAGCVLFVRDGRLATLEGYTYDDEWPENARVDRVEHIVPIFPGRAV